MIIEYTIIIHMTFDYDEHVINSHVRHSFQRTKCEIVLLFYVVCVLNIAIKIFMSFLRLNWKISIFNVRVYGYVFKSENNGQYTDLFYVWTFILAFVKI